VKPWVEAQNVHIGEAQAACDAYNEAKFGKREGPKRRPVKPSERAFLRRKTRRPSATQPKGSPWRSDSPQAAAHRQERDAKRSRKEAERRAS
jgi:hypothetical protein